MEIIDTHSHIFQPEFDNDIDEVISRAKKAGVSKILLPNIDVETISRVNNLAEKYPDYCVPMMGLHPTSVTEDWKNQLTLIKNQFDNHHYIAIGEIGIDLYWDKTLIEEQKAAFCEQLEWSIEYDLPVAIHSRDAIPECIECIKEIGSNRLRGVFHSFGGTREELENILALNNFYIGINGVVTFKNSTLLSVLQYTDLSKIVIETDSPYLAPVPFRGKRNESSYTVYVVSRLAEIYSVSLEEVSEITSRNAKNLFSL
ncbi:MAG: TatD family hydrolase [Dysgonomonas sp.]